MLIRFWGARGSIPVCGKDTLRYGGDTTCVEIRTSDGQVVVVDAGTGIRRLGKKLIREGHKSCILLFTHAHWDHVMGFPFFLPVYHKDFRIRTMGCPFAQRTIKDVISKTMQPPSFPIKFSDISAQFQYTDICERPFRIGSMTVAPILLSHPNQGMGYRFTEKGRSFVFLTDNELGVVHPGGLAMKDYVRFCRGADLLVHDSEYLDEEYPRRRAWGHSTLSQALHLALTSEVKSYGLYHHNQDRTDRQVDAMVSECRRRIRREGSKLRCFAVAQDQEVRL
ncbi:MAG TPA: MBL fold metallo-hydrolase [Elusimicrobia bacterium]|nr:MBL fold metallo-hydrolase [Elusimicrobiota bacterium]